MVWCGMNLVKRTIRTMKATDCEGLLVSLFWMMAKILMLDLLLHVGVDFALWNEEKGDRLKPEPCFPSIFVTVHLGVGKIHEEASHVSAIASPVDKGIVDLVSLWLLYVAF